MAGEVKRSLKVFLCHASADKQQVRVLYKRLVLEGVDAWLDQEKLLPGQDWRVEIPRAVKEADVVVVCLSNKSITTEGYVQKEIKFALDSADEKPEGTIFLIPARLEDCVVPERLNRWQWVDLFDEYGFIKLLRSLKLRADAVSAVVQPTSYEDSDKEIERRLEQLYTEGLAAFYTEEWDKACQRFQLILSERPGHKNAAEKLEEAERQRNLTKLYTQSMEAYKSENWQAAVKTLEELSQKSADYKDVAQLLKNSRKQKQLKELYVEARKLHSAQKWQAVLKIFEQISVLEPNHPDADGLLPSAQKEVAELKRLAELNDFYSQAVREMETGQWYEARKLLERVHKAQTGFLETERLLRKIEDEILKVEEGNKRNIQINTLYEQAHGLVRTRNWRKALDKIEEIQKLDTQFADKDEIGKKASTELEREEQEIQRQNQLAAMYAEAVRLLKEGKYQESLEKWNEIKTIDPKYPDRQWVQSTARKKLVKVAKPFRTNPLVSRIKPVWIGIGIISFFTLSYLFIKFNSPFTPDSNPTETNEIIATSTVTEERIYLANLEPISIKVGTGELGVGKFPLTAGPYLAGTILQRNGVEYPYGLFAYASSRLEYTLPGNVTSFSSSIFLSGYVEGDFRCSGTARFVIHLDGREIYESPILTSSYLPEPIEINVSVQEGNILTLITDSLGDIFCDYTVWGDPYLIP